MKEHFISHQEAKEGTENKSLFPGREKKNRVSGFRSRGEFSMAVEKVCVGSLVRVVPICRGGHLWNNRVAQKVEEKWHCHRSLLEYLPWCLCHLV